MIPEQKIYPINDPGWLIHWEVTLSPRLSGQEAGESNVVKIAIPAK